MTFYLIAITIYFTCYLYLRWWVLRLLRATPQRRRWLISTMDVVSLVLPLAQFGDGLFPEYWINGLQFIGYSWAAIVLCLFPVALLAQPVLWLLKKRLAPRWLLSGPQAFAFTSLVCVLMLIGGYLNARHPRLRPITLNVPATTLNRAPLTIVAISDLHAGKLMTRDWVADIVQQVNDQSPDLIVLLGDILDDHNARHSGALEALRHLQAPLGVVAILGNHEHYLDPRWSARQLAELGFTLLEDESLVIDDRLLLVGRRDRSSKHFGQPRLPLIRLLQHQPQLPTVVLDHNPRHLGEAQQAGAVLQLSGHTHHGQLFPFNLVTQRIYELSWGQQQRGDTLYVVSSGVGVWGPPLRTSSVPEILRLDLTFEPSPSAAPAHQP